VILGKVDCRTASEIETPRVQAYIQSLENASPDFIEVRYESVHFTRLLRSRRSPAQVRWKFAEGDTYRTVAGWMVIPSNTPMHFELEGGRIEAFRCRYDPDMYEITTGLRRDWFNEQMQAPSVQRMPCFRLIERIYDEVSNPGFAADLMIESLGTAFLIEFARTVRDLKPTPRQGALAPWQVRLVQAMMRETLGRGLSIMSMASACRVSGRHLTRGYKAATGNTIFNDVALLRIERAKQLLSKTNMPLKQIAFEVGFATPGHLSTAFGRSTGITPSNYRQLER
jgi:AraC family transcriptional regulator